MSNNDIRGPNYKTAAELGLVRNEHKLRPPATITRLPEVGPAMLGPPSAEPPPTGALQRGTQHNTSDTDRATAFDIASSRLARGMIMIGVAINLYRDVALFSKTAFVTLAIGYAVGVLATYGLYQATSPIWAELVKSYLEYRLRRYTQKERQDYYRRNLP